MKILIAIFMIGILAGCASSTEFGPCVGIGDAQNPHLIYKVSARNLIIAILGFQMIAPPVIVAVDETFCPVGVK